MLNQQTLDSGMVRKEEILSVIAKRYYHGLYEKILECMGKWYLFWGGVFWKADIDKTVIARGRVDIVNDWLGGKIIIEAGVKLNSDSHRCLTSSIFRPVKLRTHYDGAEIIIRKGAVLNGTSVVARSRCIEIGEGTNIAPNCIIMDADFHDPWPSEGRFTRPGDENDKDVTIGKNVWIGTGCIILKGTVIGDNSIIGAGSVVNSEIPAGCLAAGVPAKVVKIVEE